MIPSEPIAPTQTAAHITALHGSIDAINRTLPLVAVRFTDGLVDQITSISKEIVRVSQQPVAITLPPVAPKKP